MTGTFTSVIGPIVMRYLALKRALGREYAGVEWVLGHLDRFLVARSADLTAETFAEWCLTLQHLASGNRRNRMREVRNLCLYRRRGDPTCFVPDNRLFPLVHQAIRPHIFTEGEVRRLMAVAMTRVRTANSPLGPEMMRLAIVLLYTTGMRRRELTGLTVGDYDVRERTLRIHESKFHKSRLIPLSADTAREIEAALDARRRHRCPTDPETPLLCHGRRGYSGGGFADAIRSLFRQAGIRTSAGQAPRVQDFRHAFAVSALLRWYRAGLDVQAKLPFLAHYMGHVSIVSTAYYLQFVEPLAGAASTRFATAYGAVVKPVGAGGAR